MAILAKKNGWLIAGTVVREDSTHIFFRPMDKDIVEAISKKDKKQKIFDSVYVAQDWIDGVETK